MSVERLTEPAEEDGVAPPEAGWRHSHGWPEKRQAIAAAALEVFLRDGFARANVTDIATAAGVSKRTLYKHYGDKRELFVAVVADALASIRRRFAEAADRHLGDATDLEVGLVAFGREWAGLCSELVPLRRLHLAEVDHIPSHVGEMWLRAGPSAVQHVLERHLRRLHERGLLVVPDVVVAGRHLGALILSAAEGNVLLDFAPVRVEDVDAYVENGVRAFLGIYGCHGVAAGEPKARD